MPRIHFVVNLLLAIAIALPSASGQSRSSRMPLGEYAPDGVLEPWRTSDVACIEAGLVASLEVKLGDRVVFGQPLVKIDSRGLQAQLDVAQAQANALGRQAAARAEVELNERKAEAIRSARAKQFTSQSELERAEADLRIARGRLAAEIEETQALLLQVERLKVQLEQRTVVAPIDGIVDEIYMELGEYASPANPELLKIVDVSRLRASFYLQVEEIADLTRGCQVTVELDGGQRVLAVVEHISPVADGESGLIEFRVLIDNPEWKILGSRCTLLLDVLPPTNDRGV